MSMDLNTSSLKPGDLSPPDSASDPDEKELSDDDDDRNHKHRRRDTGSQSLERDPLEQTSTQPFRKRNRTNQNGQSDPQFQHNSNRDFSKRRLTGTNFSRFSGQHGPGRGRGRDFQWDSQMGHIGPIPPAMFTGRGLPAPNAPSASWSGFGLIPTIPNGAIDAINPLGMQGFLGPHMNPSMNMGIQRCRDFEERGFCLRGDMCPMEHGMNRIVVEDVQSLSHFNLPVSLPSAQILGTSAGSGFLSSGGASSTLMNSRGPHSRTNKDEEALSGAVIASGADVYDPDQPLWNNDVSFVDAGVSDCVVGSSGDVGGQSTNSSVWGRLRNSKKKLELKEEFPTKEICEPSSGTQGMSHVGKQTIGPKTALSNSKLQNDVGGTIRKPSYKAERTLFVNCIPLKDNKRENLLSHFRKFGEVIDIHIPANSERAFVQFSRREDAEKALKAPDAVMGSRFIKLWWANRDNIAINGVSSTNNTPLINKGKDNLQNSALRVVVPKPSDSSVAAGSNYKPVAVNSPRVAPPAQKKMESLEILKEELRKKQEMLERKRNEFRQQLDKLAKQASGKSEVPVGPAEKTRVSATSSNAPKAGSTQPSDIVMSIPSSKAEVSADKMIIENLTSERKAKSVGANPPISKQSVHPMATSVAPSRINRYKLDNRPTTFRINAPLPDGLTNVAALRDHFSSFGEISNVKIENLSEEESPNDVTDSEEMRNCSARVSFATRLVAERAFLNGKSWGGHNLQFSWVTSSIRTSSQSSGESSSALRETVDSEIQSTEKIVKDDPRNTLNPKESNSPPLKSSNELSCPSEKHSRAEVQSPDKSVGHLPLKADEPENRVSENQEEEFVGDDLKRDEGWTLLAG